MQGLIMFIIVVINFILQSTVFQYTRIFGVMPNTALIIVVCIAILKGKHIGGVIGLLAGFIQDIMFSQTIGPNALVLFFIGYLVGMTDQKLYKDSLFIPFIITAISTLAYHGLYYVLMFFLGTNIRFTYFFKRIVLIEILYNSILAIPIYKWFSKIFTVPSIRFGKR
ncbi:rod shape-determining protein MreD [Anaerosalibacter sp. Marseille-P3206]|uniref:rod shape-determining protein MreD n=1 Tax=Anaerosalibacter sp. Marseille-P3206 TaxID=1871005 RepID=UPI000BE93046|nr:rod shape-determining protein MreD [Anaerosalibacter sp. Marseille-P3206]